MHSKNAMRFASSPKARQVKAAVASRRTHHTMRSTGVVSHRIAAILATNQQAQRDRKLMWYQPKIVTVPKGLPRLVQIPVYG